VFVNQTFRDFVKMTMARVKSPSIMSQVESLSWVTLSLVCTRGVISFIVGYVAF